MKTLKISLLIIFSLLTTSCKLLDTPPDYDQPRHKNTVNSTPGIFSDSEKRMIFDYYSDHGRNKSKKAKKLPKGLQKKYERTGQLPPGWQMKMARGEVIPADIYRHGRDIPYELSRRLPIGPVGSKILEIEGKIIRVIHNTREIIDILDL